MPRNKLKSAHHENGAVVCEKKVIRIDQVVMELGISQNQDLFFLTLGK